MSTKSLLLLHLLQHYPKGHHFFVEPSSKPVVEAPQKKIEEPPKPLDFELTTTAAAQPSESRLSNLQKLFPNQRFVEEPKIVKRPIALITMSEERKNHTTLFQNLGRAINEKIHPCEIFSHDLEFASLDAKIRARRLKLIIASKSSIRVYPKIKELYSKGRVAGIPLILVDEIDEIANNPTKKRELWNKIQHTVQSS